MIVIVVFVVVVKCSRANRYDLMNIICSVGLAQNFAAVKSLVTSGIQKGHMKMHLINLLIKQNATKSQIDKSEEYFRDKDISSQSVKDFLDLN